MTIAKTPSSLPVCHAAAQSGALDMDSLPEWRLDDLYAGLDDPRIQADLAALEADIEAFAKEFAGTLPSVAADGTLGGAVMRYEAIEERIGRLGSFAGLVFTTKSSDPARAKFYADMQNRLTTLSSGLLFFEHELNDIDDEVLEQALKTSAHLAKYRPWLRRLRLLRPYRLSQDLERLSLERSQTARTAWTRLFDQTIAGLRVTVDGEKLTLVEATDRLTDPDRSRREASAKAIADGAAENHDLFALIFNTIVKDQAIDDRWRGLASPTEGRHLSNDVDGEVVEALSSAVQDAYGRLSHRFMAWKAKAMGLERMKYWDRIAPLPGGDTAVIPWDEARDRVLGAFGRFSPTMADIGARFFDKGWIDAPARPGKSGGAFAHPTVPSVHPYILLNYRGKSRDVMTLAHELGHGVHQTLAAEQGLMLSNTPLTLAETASVFGEMLTFRALLDSETDPARRRFLLASKVEDKLGTVVRQIAFYEFEKAVHFAVRDGELTPDEFGRLWRQTQDAALGPIIDLEGYEGYWSLVPHFIHTPFYVYAYAFGDGLVNALYDLYDQSSEGFVERYMELLRAGGTKRYDEALKPFGLDARDPAFWNRGLDLIERMIDELEAMDR